MYNIINAVHATYLFIKKKYKKNELQLKHLNAYIQVLYRMFEVRAYCITCITYKFISTVEL